MRELDKAAVAEEVRGVLRATLQMPASVRLNMETQLLGGIPELDSMAVVAVMTALEDRFGFVIQDDEISAETFATLASLVGFIEAKARA
jgi:acyl carrier protein